MAVKQAYSDTNEESSNGQLRTLPTWPGFGPVSEYSLSNRKAHVVIPLGAPGAVHTPMLCSKAVL